MVAERIKKYTQEEIEELQRRYDKAYEQLDQTLILDMQEEAREKGLAQGRAEGRVEGIAEGKTEAQIENIKTMHSNGADFDMIAKLLNLESNMYKKTLEE